MWRLRKARPTYNEFFFFRRVGGCGYYRWNSLLQAYVEEVE